MFTTLKALPSPRRLVAPLVIVSVALAIAAAFVLDPGGSVAYKAVSQDHKASGGGGVGTSTLYATGDETPLEGDPSRGLGGDDVTSAGTSAPGTAMEEPAMPDMQAKSMATDGELITGSAPADLGLKVIQNANVEIRFRKGRLDAGYRRAISAAEAVGGYVVSSNISEDTRSKTRVATLTLRVPNGKFNQVLDRLGEGGKVMSLAVSSQDVTQEYVDSRSRLRHDQAVEQRLLDLLGKAKSVSDALVIQDRLNDIQQQIEIEKGRLNYLDKLTAMATIEVTMTEGRIPGTKKRERWGIAQAFETAAHRFVGNVNRAIVATGGALPGLLALALALLAGRSIHRRRQRREVAGVDPSAGDGGNGAA